MDNKVTKIECSNGLVKLCTPENTELYSGHRRVEEELGRIGISGALGLERRKDHPEHREEEEDGNYPGHQRPKVTPRLIAVSDGECTLAAGSTMVRRPFQAAADRGAATARKATSMRTTATISVRIEDDDPGSRTNSHGEVVEHLLVQVIRQVGRGRARSPRRHGKTSPKVCTMYIDPSRTPELHIALDVGKAM